MHEAIIYIAPKGPSPIGWSQAAGTPGDVRFRFKTQSNMAYPNIAALNPQLVLRPFTQLTVGAYDIVIDDVTGAAGTATIPPSVMNDRFTAEVYTRNSEGQPQRMIACGRVDLTGYAYEKSGPLGPFSYSIGPSGPAGPQGVQGPQGSTGPAGARGSMWFTGAGDPPTSGIGPLVTGDMWLDETTGNVWRYDGTGWLRHLGT